MIAYTVFDIQTQAYIGPDHYETKNIYEAQFYSQYDMAYKACYGISIYVVRTIKMTFEVIQ